MNDDSWDGGVGVLRAKVEGGALNWDVVEVELEELALGCDEGLFEKIDYTKIGGKDAYLPEAVNDCGVGAIVYDFILAYDGDKLKDGPKSWADFFDLKKFPGMRALRQGPKTTLEIALMADGVAAEGCLYGAWHRCRRRARLCETQRDPEPTDFLEGRRAATPTSGIR